ncbi:MAG TPA: DUF2252 domain-containing protein [Ktedonosporobacter sp.]|nr:DUF2252 domain-containing protein [Ktedonosporobacter sp.]
MNTLNSLVLAEPGHRTLAEGRAMGRELRKRVPRSSHAAWSPAADRPDSIGLLQGQDRSRLAQLVPLRYSRMMASPFGFLRGSAVVMAGDLVATPVTGLQVQMCGDAHLGNFGVYATPERNQVFDVNDFDETLPGPWEWDVKRLAASIVVAGRTIGFTREMNGQAAVRCIRSYRERMWIYGEMCHTDVWYARIDPESIRRFVGRSDRSYVEKELAKARRSSSLVAFPRLTTKVKGQYRIKDDPPTISHLDDEELARQLGALVEGYSKSLLEERTVLLRKYRLVDIAYKIVGVGSVGTRCYIALLMGTEGSDPLILQVKQAEASVFEPHLGASSYLNHAQRVVRGQSLMQAASDIFLGWTELGSIDLYVRQLRDMKFSVSVERLNESRFERYCELCGWALARAHARSGDPAQISGYLGSNDTFDRATASFAQAYADQTERDHAELLGAAQAGRIPIETGISSR